VNARVRFAHVSCYVLWGWTWMATKIGLLQIGIPYALMFAA
jgi:hypothetical protein